MKDINDVYDVIDIMRRRHDLSIRRLAICANIAPTTSGFSTKPFALI